MVLLLSILGGMTLGCSLLFFLAPQQINKRNIGNIVIGQKPKEKTTQNLFLNKIISIDEKITTVSVTTGVFLLVITAILFWTASTLTK